MMHYTLDKSKHIKGRTTFQTLLRQAQGSFKYPYKLLYLPNSSADAKEHQMAVSVSKRRLKHAVDRNKIKRRTREAYRLNQSILDTLPPHRLLFIYAAKQEVLPYATIEAAIKYLLHKVSNEYNGKNSSITD